MFAITWILPVTIFALYTVSTSETCILHPESGIYTFNCNKQHANDETLAQIYSNVALLIGGRVSKHTSVSLLLEFNEIKRLGVIQNYPQFLRIIRLSFRGNLIIEVEEGAFENLWGLRTLDLSKNQLTTEKLTSKIFKTKNGNGTSPIEHLNLEYNKLTDLKPDLFIYLRKLKTLLLGQNALQIIGHSISLAFESLGELRVLDLSHTQLMSEYPDENFLLRGKVQELHLMGNDLTEVPPYIRNTKQYLRILNLNGNLIEKLNSTSFGVLPTLEELHLNGMVRLTEIGANTFSSLTNLRKLECSYNKNLQTVDPSAFEGLKDRWSLQEINLNNNGLKYLSNDTILWDKLQVLNLGGNPWNCTCSISWLMNFTRQRQVYDPESKLGMHCGYPEDLNRRSLVFANAFLKCSSNTGTGNSAENSSMMRFLTISNLFFIIVVGASVGILSYLLMKRIQRARMLKARYSGTIVKSMAKYKLARLSDQGETQSDVDDPINTRPVE